MWISRIFLVLMKLVGIPLLILAALSVSAGSAEIRWPASGSVSGQTGVGFPGSITVGSPVEITMVYDSTTAMSPRSFLNFGSAFFGEAWFYGAAELAITVRIGETLWRGEMPMVPAGQNVMVSSCWDGGGSPDRFTVTLDSARGGTFPDFPYTGLETSRALVIEFRDDQSPAGLFTIHQLPDTLSCLPEMTSASGAVRAGADAILFTLDVSTVKVAQPQVQLSIATENGGIRLTWNTEEGKSYRLDSTANLKCWFEEGKHVGNGNPVHQLLFPFLTNPRRFYRVVEY